jgi:ABC-type transport system substrate-binding protein
VNMNAEERAAQYMEIASIIYDEAVFLPLYQMIDAVGTSDRLVWSPPQDGFFWMGNASLQ